MSRRVLNKKQNIAYDDVKKLYYVTLDYGKDTDGERIRKYKTFKTKKEAQEHFKLFEAERIKNTLVIPTKQTVGMYGDYWLGNIKVDCAATTIYGYSNILYNHIIPQLGNIPIQDLSTKELNIYFRYMSEEKGLSNNTIRKHQDLLHMILKEAVNEGVINMNPMERIKKKALEKTENTIYTLEELQVLFEKVEGTILEIPVKLAGTTGVRRGEINGLMWEQVDLEKGYIQISKTRTKAGAKEIHKGTKSTHSNRKIKVKGDLLELLIKAKKEQQQSKELLGAAYNVEAYVFCKSNGDPYGVNYISNEFKELLANNGLNHMRFHDLRHSFASAAISLGVSVYAVSKALGHHNSNFTESTYVQKNQDNIDAGFEIVADTLKATK